ncbi:MAG: hypothetical protein V2A71_02445 [Candidatus Eisenbacteria bacterium]
MGRTKTKSHRRIAGHGGRAPGSRFRFRAVLGRVRFKPWHTLAFILGGGFLLHAPALKAPFFADDYVFLDHVRFKPLIETFFSTDPLGNFFRPLGRQFYFWLIAHIGHESPVVFHACGLCLFLACLALLFLIVNRLAGQVAGAFAAGFLALHYSADLPLLWTSGSQDLLSLTGGLAAILLFLKRRPWWAAVSLFLALLCKETVVLTPFVAVLLAHWETRSWKKAFHRAATLLGVLVPWGILWMTFGSRVVAPGVQLELGAGGFLAALVQLGRVTLGLEWRTGEFGSQFAVFPPVLALLPIVIAILLCRSSRTASESGGSNQTRGSTDFPPMLGLAWALLGALPVALVAGIWSAYYYLFAIAGVALALGSWAARFPRWVALVLMVSLAWTSHGARRVDEFAGSPGAWSAQSHMNGWWFSRGSRIVESYVRNLKETRPTVPEGSTFFFFDIAGYTIWHSGPIVRWAYQDSSLHGHYLREFSLDKARGGPLFYFKGQGERLVEATGDYAVAGLANGAILSENLGLARDALVFSLESNPDNKSSAYCLAFVEWAREDTVSAVRLLREAGIVPDRGPTRELAAVRALAGSGDREQASGLMQEVLSRHGLDPEAHALLADILLAGGQFPPAAIVSAFAARVLAPEDPSTWRRWGLVQYSQRLYSQASVSLERYFAIGGQSARGDTQIREILNRARRLEQGGEEVQAGIRGDARPPDP